MGLVTERVLQPGTGVVELRVIGQVSQQLCGRGHVADPPALAGHQLDHRRDRHPEHTQGSEEDLLHESYPTSVGVAVTTSRSTGAPGIVTEPGTSRQAPPLTRYVAVYVVSTLGPTCPFFR